MAWLLKTMETQDGSTSRELILWQSPPVIAGAMQTFFYSLFAMHINGMETGLNALLMLLFLAVYSKIPREKGWSKNLFWLGVIGGFLVLSRIDAVVLILIVALLELRFANGFRN